MLPTPTPDICQFWDTAELFGPAKAHQKMPKHVKCQNRPKFRVLCAKKGKIGHRLEKSTSTPIVTNIRYGPADLLPATKFFSLLHFRRAPPLPLKFKYWNAMHKLFISLRATNRAWQRRNITIHQITTFQPRTYFTLSLILVQTRIGIIVLGLFIVLRLLNARLYGRKCQEGLKACYFVVVFPPGRALSKGNCLFYLPLPI